MINNQCFGKKVLYRGRMKSSWVRAGPNSNKHPYKRSEGGERREDITKIEAKTEVMPPQATERQGLQASRRREEWNQLSRRVSRRNQPCRHLNFRLLTSGAMRQSISVVFSHQPCGHLLWQPQITNTEVTKTTEEKNQDWKEGEGMVGSGDFKIDGLGKARLRRWHLRQDLQEMRDRPPGWWPRSFPGKGDTEDNLLPRRGRRRILGRDCGRTLWVFVKLLVCILNKMGHWVVPGREGTLSGFHVKGWCWLAVVVRTDCRGQGRGREPGIGDGHGCQGRGDFRPGWGRVRSARILRILWR